MTLWFGVKLQDEQRISPYGSLELQHSHRPSSKAFVVIYLTSLLPTGTTIGIGI